MRGHINSFLPLNPLHSHKPVKSIQAIARFPRALKSRCTKYCRYGEGPLGMPGQNYNGHFIEKDHLSTFIGGEQFIVISILIL